MCFLVYVTAAIKTKEVKTIFSIMKPGFGKFSTFFQHYAQEIEKYILGNSYNDDNCRIFRLMLSSNLCTRKMNC